MRAVFFSTLFILSVSTAPVLKAQTISLKQAINRAVQVDPRLRERKQQMVNVARAIEQQSNIRDDLLYDVKFFVGLATTKTNGSSTIHHHGDHPDHIDSHPTEHNFEGIAPWYNLRLSIVKPLYSFGKAENFSTAAREDVAVKQGDVALIRSKVKCEVYETYYEYLAARDSRRLLEDVKGRLEKAIDLVEKWLREGGGNAKQSDVFALQTRAALTNRSLAKFQGTENISLNRLKKLIGLNLNKKLEVADKGIVPVELPKTSLKKLQKKALANRPEMAQLKASLNARRNLVKTDQPNLVKPSRVKPSIDAGLAGSFPVAPGSAKLNSPLLQDSVKNAAAVANNVANNVANSGASALPNGELKEDKNTDVQSSPPVLNSLIKKLSITQQDIPLQVSEQYQFVQTHYTIVEELAKGSRAGRRWMIASYADFEAGLIQPDKIMDAFQGYVLAHTDYLKAVNDYNMRVIRLKSATGEL